MNKIAALAGSTIIRIDNREYSVAYVTKNDFATLGTVYSLLLTGKRGAFRYLDLYATGGYATSYGTTATAKVERVDLDRLASVY